MLIASQEEIITDSAEKTPDQKAPDQKAPGQKAPGPRGLFGFNIGLRTLRVFQKSPMQFLQQLAADYGDIAAFRLGPINAVLVNHPELVREVLATNKDDFPKLGRQAKTIRLIDGNSLFVKEGDEWLSDRRLIQSAFTPAKMPGYASDMLQIASHRIAGWSDGSEIDFCDETTELAILIAGKTLLGSDLSSSLVRLRQMAYERADVFVREMSAPVRIPDGWPLPSKRQKRRVIETMDDVIYSIMRDKRLANGPEENGSARIDSNAQPSDLLSILINAAAETEMSDSQIRDHANMLFQAGVDDIATAMVWMFYLVAGHPEIQARMKQEIADVAGERELTIEDLPQLRFIDRVVNETLRLYPSTWMFTARKAACGTTLGGESIRRYSIRHRTWIFVSPYVTQRDERFFSEPDKFDPDRFLPERFGKLQQSAYFPFGIGPRACAGTRFSIMELVLIAATMLQKFTLERLPGLDHIAPVPKVTVRPAKAIRIIVHRD